MAIAFDAETEQLVGPGVTSNTFAHTCTGSNLILFVGVLITAGDDISGVTYNGISMTQINKVNSNLINQFSYLYYLVAPAIGTNNVVISATTGTFIRGHAVSYTGANQSGVPDAQQILTTPSPNTSLTVSVTTIADNCWTVMEAGTQGVSLSASTGSHLVSTSNDSAFFDSNGIIHPAGSYSMKITASGVPSGGIGAIMASFAPFVAPPANGNFLMFM